jgi:hypothetical protein
MLTFDCPYCCPTETYWSRHPGPHTCELCGTELVQRADGQSEPPDEFPLANPGMARLSPEEQCYREQLLEAKGDDMLLLPRNQYPDIPQSVAVCPICGRAVVIDDIDEWEEDDAGLLPSECGLHIECETEPDIDSPEWESWFREHWSTPYIDWLPVEHRVYQWLVSCHRFAETESEQRERLRAWNAGEPRRAESE